MTLKPWMKVAISIAAVGVTATVAWKGYQWWMAKKAEKVTEKKPEPPAAVPASAPGTTAAKTRAALMARYKPAETPGSGGPAPILVGPTGGGVTPLSMG